MITSLAGDIRRAFRQIGKAPVLSAVIIGSIAIGIGVNTTVFSWIQSRVLTPIAGVSGSGKFYLVEARGEMGSYPGLSWPEYKDLTARLSLLQNVIAFRMAPLNVGAADWSDRTYGLLVSGNYFSALGLRAAAGRLIDGDDTAQPGATAVAIVSHRFWQSRLGGATDVVGHSLRVNDRVFTIAGVAPAGFQGTVMGLTFDLWLPATAVPLIAEGTRELDSRSQRGYMALAALAPGASRADAQRDLDAAMQALAAAYPESNATVRAEVLPQWQSPRGPQQSLMAALAMLQGAMLLVLVVVAGNTTNLVLARASVRRKEVGLMLALGAGRWRVISLILTENLVLTLLGALGGVALAVWGTNALRAVPLPTPGGLQLTFFTQVDWVSLAFASVLGVVSGLVIGLPPALQLSRINPQASLRAGGAAAGRSTMRDVLLALEVAVAMVALVVSAMFLKSFNDTRTTDPGFTREGVLLATYDLRGRNQATESSAMDFSARLLDGLQASPGIDSAALATSVPLDIHGMPSRRFAIDGRARPDGSLDEALTNTVTPGYFQTMGIPMLAGKDFAGLRDSSPAPQAIVNEEFVKRFVGTTGSTGTTGTTGTPDYAAAIGRRIETVGRQFVIAGVVRDSLYEAFGETPKPFIYLSWRDRPSPMAEVHVRTRGGSEKNLTADVRRIVRDLDATLPVYNVRTLNEHVDSNLVFRKIPARMFGVLGPMLLLLVGVGIYAVVAYGVAQRRKEIGTRVALGATSLLVIRSLLADTMRVVLLGMAAGSVAALMINPGALSGQASELRLMAGVILLFLAAATIASWVPARHASRINPIVVLKE